MTIPTAIHIMRRLPIHIREEVAEELDSMCRFDVIKRVHEPTLWVSSLTYARKKSGSIRLCLDLKDLNKSIMRPHYAFKTV